MPGLDARRSNGHLGRSCCCTDAEADNAVRFVALMLTLAVVLVVTNFLQVAFVTARQWSKARIAAFSVLACDVLLALWLILDIARGGSEIGVLAVPFAASAASQIWLIGRVSAAADQR